MHTLETVLLKSTTMLLSQTHFLTVQTFHKSWKLLPADAIACGTTIRARWFLIVLTLTFKISFPLYLPTASTNTTLLLRVLLWRLMSCDGEEGYEKHRFLAFSPHLRRLMLRCYLEAVKLDNSFFKITRNEIIS